MATLFSPLVENAIRLADYWHQNQKRKGGEFNYITHPMAVALILARAGFDDGVIAAGLCHDLLEDTACPAEDILESCGPRVLHLVEAVSENASLDLDKDWEKRKKQYIESVRNGSAEAKAVCVADKIHNLTTLIASLEEQGMSYFKYFHRGPEEKLWFEDHVCMMLQETWSHPLVDEYNALIDHFVDILEHLDTEDKSYQSKVDPDDRSDFDDPVDVETEEHEHLPLIPIQYTDNEADISPLLVNDACEEVSQSSHFIQENDGHGDIDNHAKKVEQPSIYGGKYLADEEVEHILPAVLQLGITKGILTNRMLQDQLKLSYTMAFKVLKELKRLHVIKQADSFKPRKVYLKEAKEILSALVN